MTGPSIKKPKQAKNKKYMLVRYSKMNALGLFEHNETRIPRVFTRVVVKTEKGLELGYLVGQLTAYKAGQFKLNDEQIKKYYDDSNVDFSCDEAGKFVRFATPDDISEERHLQKISKDEIECCQRLAEELGLSMKIVDAEHIFGGERIIFYFMSDSRVDFRELVKRLSHEYQTRIEMRQIGSRDEAKILGDIETCGQQCCCKRFLKFLKPVNMRMAKMQKATLDPSKISGYCGRLKCCLRYEDKTYSELKKRLPRKNTRVKTKYGEGKVVDAQILTQLVVIEYESGERVAVPVDEIEIISAPEITRKKTDDEKEYVQDEQDSGQKQKSVDTEDDKIDIPEEKSMTRKIVVTSALPYANGPIHIGHLVEYLQTDIWVRFQKLCGNQCLYFCADDTHGTPIMISARSAGISPEELIERVYKEHRRDFESFNIEFDNYYTTHSPENKLFSELIFNRLNESGSIVKRNVEQAYCENCNMSLPDRFVRGTCPRCKAEDQYGDSCEICSATYRPTELINPYCATCRKEPTLKTSEHYFFKLVDYEQRLKDLIASGHTQKSVANKLDEWFKAGLKDWDISRDGPYFGFKIPGEENKFFYVWLDAPIGYMASAKNYFDKNKIDFDKIWNSEEYELYHFIGKDIMYFHALFWPAMLIGAGFRPANKLFVHGFLTVNGEKMSKSRGTFVKASIYLKHLNPEYLRYYYASKLTDSIDDIDLNIDDFVNKINSALIGKLANLASRSGPMVTKKLNGQLGQADDKGEELINKLIAAKDKIIQDYENLNFAAVVRTVTALADKANRYVEQNRPWVTVKTDLEKTRATLTAVINAVRILTIYLKPILPKYAEKVQKFLNVDDLNFADVEKTLQNHKINDFERLLERIDKEQVIAMMEESKETQSAQPSAAEKSDSTAAEPLKPECTIEDFGKIDLRIAKIIKAEPVEGADKLLRLVLDMGGPQKTCLAAIATAYKPEELAGKLVVYLANLKPRQMRFGLSEGMILAAGTGGKDIYILSVDSGAKPGQKVL